ncbi:hypothetical protein [Mucilaginibacter sp.]|uniref:hypothetical protein n=1 Tax=Mucilaginibacter sp. TaxID=1882438 RepID=UPI002ED5A435
MKKIREFASQWYVVLPLCLVFIIESCSKSQNIKSATDSELTGEAIFRAVFFGQGSAAALVAPYSMKMESLATNANDRAGIIEAEESIVKSIKATEPSFFDQFGSQMKSGNPTLVNGALVTAGKDILKALNPKIDVSKIILNKDNAGSLKSAFASDGLGSMNTEQAVALLKTQKYKKLLGDVVGAQSPSVVKEQLVEDPGASTTKPIYDTNVAVYKWLVIAAGAFVVLLVAIEEAPSAENITGIGSKDQLFHEQMVASFTQQFATK